MIKNTIYERKIINVKFIFLLSFLAINVHGQSQDKVIIGDLFSVHSKILGENRNIQIYLPESYKSSTYRYPTLYLLDSEYEFHHTTGTVSFLEGTGKIPEMIVIGIVNTNRSRDLTPEAPNDEENKAFWGEIGGAKNFRKFIKEELIPLIDKKYRTDGYKILRGQSFGGLFGLVDFFETDKTFNAYLLTSPTVRWNENKLFDQLNNSEYKKNNKIKIYIGEAEFDSGSDTGISDFSQKLLIKIKDSTYFKYGFYKGESHYSLVFNATQNGLKFIYQNWQLPAEISANGTLINLIKHYTKLSEEFGYTLKVPMNEIIRLTNIQLRKKEFDKAIEIAKQNIEFYPNQPETYWHTGDAYSFAENYAMALKYFKLALKKAKETGALDLADYKNSVTITANKLN